MADSPRPAPGLAPDAGDPMPLPPPPIDLDACCGQGCEPCVLELQAQAWDRYRADLAAWQARHPDRGDRASHAG